MTTALRTAKRFNRYVVRPLISLSLGFIVSYIYIQPEAFCVVVIVAFSIFCRSLKQWSGTLQARCVESAAIGIQLLFLRVQG